MKNIVQSALADRVKSEKASRDANLEERKQQDKKDFKKNMDHIKTLESNARSRPLLIESTGKQSHFYL
jgi:hypothetical protein